MRRYIENLKKINIVKTPFQTSSKRFIENKSENKIIMENDTEKKSPRGMPKVRQQSSAFKSGTKREVFKTEGRPGPGDYDHKVKNNGNYQDL